MTSKIKVDNINKVSDDSTIIKKCGSTTTVGSGAGNTIVVCGATVTLGRCGGAVNIASGATTSGMGRTGTVDWCTTAKTAPFTAVSGDGFFVNTSGGAVTVTLPASPSGGDIIALKDYAGTFGAACKAVTICSNSSKVNGIVGTVVLDQNNQSTTLIYVDGTQGWLAIDGSTFNVLGNIQYNVDYLVVGGGGGASAPPTYGGTGAGAGGYRTATSFTVGVNCGPYTVTVGGGGAGASSGCTGKGDNSVFGPIISTGGGKGGIGGPAGTTTQPGHPGGSGSGAQNTSAGTGNDPPVSPPQGNNGGIGEVGAGNVRSGGGGGAGAVGGDATALGANTGASGGSGTNTTIFGSIPQAPTYGTPGPNPGRYFAGGGAGRGGFPPSPGTAGSGGTGGGGGNSTNGTTNTGGGGGGGRVSTGGSGGSGIVVIKHATADATACVAGGNVVATCGSNTIRIFTSDGTFTP